MIRDTNKFQHSMFANHQLHNNLYRNTLKRLIMFLHSQVTYHTLQLTHRRRQRGSLCIVVNVSTHTDWVPPGTGFCDSVISTTFVKLRFPNQCVSTPWPHHPHPPKQSQKLLRRRHHMVRNTEHMVSVTANFEEKRHMQPLQGQLINIGRVRGMKIQHISYRSRLQSHGFCFHAFASARLCLVMWLIHVTMSTMWFSGSE